jgi:Leucine-rich repeat (LRR) protein
MAAPAPSTPNLLTDRPPRCRRWIPLSLRIFLILLTIAGAASGWVLVRGYRQLALIREIRRLGGRVHQVARGPAWLRKQIGEERMSAIDEVDRIDFSSTRVTDSDLACVKGFQSLRELELWSTPVTGAGIIHLKTLPNLQRLGLGWAISPAEIAQLKELKNLQELRLCGREITNASLATLSDLKHLRALTLSDRQITDDGIAHLKGLRELRRLRLSGTGITDAGLSNLKAMSQLEHLTLDSNDISDTGLAHLLGLFNLRDLYLGGTQITDSGVAHLKTLLHLENVNLMGTSVTDTGVEDLKRALPRIKILK